MHRTLILLIGLLLLGLLAWFCIPYQAPRIEAQLAASTAAVLREQGLTGISTVLDGRDVTVTGAIPDAATSDKVQALMLGVPGVRAVSNALQILEQTLEPVPDRSEDDLEAGPLEPTSEKLPQATSEEGVQVSTAAAAEVAKAAAATCQEQFNTLLLGESVQFESGAARIKAQSFTLLDELVGVAATCPDADIEIAGHTDASGAAAANQTLSERRAVAVLEYLSQRGIPRERLSARGYGEEQPIAENDTAAGRARNRRVEFVVEGV